MIASATKLTARQFLELGQDPWGVRLELVDGQISAMPSPWVDHSYSVGALNCVVMEWVIQHNLGEVYGDVSIALGEHEVRRSDLIFIGRDRLDLVGKTAIEGPPDLCVDILDPFAGQIDREDKFKQYEAGKVANYWIIDPAKRTIEAFALKHGAYVSAGSGKGSDTVHLLPFKDLPLPLGRLWRPKR